MLLCKYSKKYINKMLKYLYRYCDVYVDRERLDNVIEDVKNEKKQEEKTSKYYKYKSIDEMQIKAIREKFEKGIKIKKSPKIVKHLVLLYKNATPKLKQSKLSNSMCLKSMNVKI